MSDAYFIAHVGYGWCPSCGAEATVDQYSDGTRCIDCRECGYAAEVNR